MEIYLPSLGMGQRGSCRAGADMVRQEPHRLTLPGNELVGQSR